MEDGPLRGRVAAPPRGLGASVLTTLDMTGLIAALTLPPRARDVPR